MFKVPREPSEPQNKLFQASSRLRLLHRQLSGAAPEPLQVGQQGGEVLVRDLEGAGMSSGPAGGARRH